jgi:single-strand DNA-binding protein
MPNLNKVMLMGTLTRDPEVKYTPKGTAICQIGLAINRNYTTDSGEKREDVTFVDCESFGKSAETIGEYCKKGRPLYVEGRLKLDTWDDKQSGQKRSKLKVIIDAFQFLGGKREDADDTPRQPARQEKPAQRPKPPVDPDLDSAPDDIPF